MTDRHAAIFLKRHFTLVWWILCIALSGPALLLAYRFWREALGVNPLQMMTTWSGHAAIVCVLLSLSLTPLRRFLAFFCQVVKTGYGKRLSDWNSIIRLRRMMGLWSFAYALLHVCIWLEFDLGWQWQEFTRAIYEKPFIAAGLLAIMLLFPLAMTSSNAAVRLLRNNWKLLHRLAYLAAGLAWLHYFLSAKVGLLTTPIIYGVVLSALLGYRLLSAGGIVIANVKDDSNEIPERSVSSPSVINSLSQEKAL